MSAIQIKKNKKKKKSEAPINSTAFMMHKKEKKGRHGIIIENKELVGLASQAI